MSLIYIDNLTIQLQKRNFSIQDLLLLEILKDAFVWGQKRKINGEDVVLLSFNTLVDNPLLGLPSVQIVQKVKKLEKFKLIKVVLWEKDKVAYKICPQVGKERKGSKVLSQARVAELRKEAKAKQLAPYLPLSEQLFKIISEKLKITKTTKRINAWAEHFKRLVEVDGIDIARVQSVLNWYASNFGNAFVPVVISGQTFREKFLRLELAMQRNETVGENISESKKMEQVLAAFASRLPIVKTPSFRRLFMETCFIPAYNILTTKTVQNKIQLFERLFELYEYIILTRQKLVRNEATLNLLDSPIELITKYIGWLQEQTWLSDFSILLFSPTHKLFQRFILEEAQKTGYHPLSGKVNKGRRTDD